MKILAAAGYLILFRDLKLTRLIKTYSKLPPSFKDQRALHMLHGITT